MSHRAAFWTDVRPATPAEPPNGGRRLCGEPSGRRTRPAPEGKR
jgi:hypothetical protein